MLTDREPVAGIDFPEYDQDGNPISYGPANEQAVAAAEAEEAERYQRVPAWVAKLRPAGDAILDEPEQIEPIWGSAENVFWAAGESLLITGPSGIGKTTVVQQLVLASLGIGSGSLLGHPVEECGRILYLAMDRPRQIKRSFRRMVAEEDRDILNERLVLWEGPLPDYLPSNPLLLLDMAHWCGATRIVVDSLKDVAYDLESPETGARYNAARQHCLAAGLDLIEITHQRKRSAGNSKPKTLDDVFGAVWLSAGAGSVLLVWGAPGDPVVEVSQLKYAAGDMGTLRVLIDHRVGSVTIDDDGRIEDVVKAAPAGMTVSDVVRVIHGPPPAHMNKTEARNRKMKVMRQLDALCGEDGPLECDTMPDTGKGSPAKVYFKRGERPARLGEAAPSSPYNEPVPTPVPTGEEKPYRVRSTDDPF